jgi:hypothetical protein
MAQFPQSFGTAFATAGFSFDPNLSPNNQAFAAAVLATVGRAGLPFGFEAANVILAGPASGAAALPTYRAIVLADISAVLPFGGTGTFSGPTNKVSGTATAGTSTAAMRSDGAPALDWAQSPTWTGNHTYTPASGLAIAMNAAPNAGAITVNGGTNTTNTFLVRLLSAGAAGFSSGLNVDAGSNASDSSVLIRSNAGATNYFQIKGDGTILGGGPVAGALVDMTPDTGTVTLTQTGGTTAPTVSAVWARVGKLAMITIPAFAAMNSNSTTLTFTGIPAAIQSARTVALACPQGAFKDGGAIVNDVSMQMLASSGTITFFRTGNSSGFTNSATNKGLVNLQMTVCWPLN